jgi:hypothetical protein
MSRIPTPTLDTAIGATAEVYTQIKKAAGKVPNPFAAIDAREPAALNAMLEADRVLAAGALSKQVSGNRQADRQRSHRLRLLCRRTQPAREAGRAFFLSECFAMVIERCLLSLSLMLFIGVAAAQTPSGPIVDGRRPQPTQQQVDSREDNRARQWNRGVQSEIDRLYDEVMRASAPQGR